MKVKKILALALAGATALSMAACGSGSAANGSDDSEGLKYADIKLGTTKKDLKATITLLTPRTDMAQADYPGKGWDDYVADFNKEYPNITVKINADTNYGDDALTRLQGGDWGDMMMIPAIDKSDLSTYFMPMGDLATMKKEVNWADAWTYDDDVYGVAPNGNVLGVVYNKKVFKEAGITELPKTPSEFLKALKLIKEKTDATPLYTNYAAGWTMGSWDMYIGYGATGDVDFMNNTFLHSATAFSHYKDSDTGPYAVFKLLYDAVDEKLIEDDYSTTDWEGSKGQLNSGKIGTMFLGQWAVTQIQGAGDNADDVGYMPFPISVDGKQYATTGNDYSFGVNKNQPLDNRDASMIFIKWMTEKSGYALNEGSLPGDANDDSLPESLDDFEGVTLGSDKAAKSADADLLNTLNSDSELAFNSSGDKRIQAIVEHAANGDESYDDLVKEWNTKWNEAQKNNDVTTVK